MNKLSNLIEQLTNLWLEWMNLNSITINELYSFKRRRETAIRQEFITKERYKIIEEINKIFGE